MSTYAFLKLVENGEKTISEAENTTKVRVKFPDGYILQGTFNNKEKVKDVVEFVKENLVTSKREFYLYKTPPKQVLIELNKTLIAQKLSPRCFLYFAWSDTKIGDDSFLNLNSL